MRRNRPLRLARMCLGFVVVLCSALVRGDALTPEVREARRQEIARKSESERARLQRNFKAFRDLSPAEQDHLRQFARELKEDDRGEGKLRPVMNEYYEWLLSLTFGQAEDLRKEADPGRRDKLVRDLLKKQQELADATGTKAGVKTPRGLSLDDLDSVLKVVEQAIHKFLSPEEIEQLKKKHGVARHSYVLEMAFRPRAGAGMQAIVAQWWSKDVLEAMVSAVTNPGQHHQLKTNVERGPRFIMLQLLIAGINAEYESEHEKIKPDQDTLERFFVQLSSAEQDEIMRLPFDQQQKKLLDTYLTKKSLEDPDNFPKPPQFPWLKRLQQQAAAQRAAANRSGEPPRAGEGDGAHKENAKKKNNKGKDKKSAIKSLNDSE